MIFRTPGTLQIELPLQREHRSRMRAGTLKVIKNGTPKSHFGAPLGAKTAKKRLRDTPEERRKTATKKHAKKELKRKPVLAWNGKRV